MRPSRRTRKVDPANRRFPNSLFRRCGDGASLPDYCMNDPELCIATRCRQNWLKPHLPGMRCDLVEEADAALARLLSDTINDDRYLLSVRDIPR